MHFFLKKFIIFCFFLNLFNSQLALCEDNINIKKTDLIENQNLNLSPMLQNVMPSVVRVITSYHNFHNKYLYDAYKEGNVNNAFHINENDLKYKNLLNTDKLPKIYTHYSLNRTDSKKLGSGVIIDSENSYVITNYHVISEASKIDVYLTNGEVYHASVIGKNRDMDLALLKLKNANSLKSINIADYKSVHVGDYAIAIGSPYNLKNSVSFGVVSALNRSNHELNLYDDYIQTDAAINHGNSGGPLVNIKGELIGINTCILSDSSDNGNVGIGFAIPTNTILRFVDQIKKNGEYHPGELGVSVIELNRNIINQLKLPDHRGILISSVQENSAAQENDIYPGDIITAINKMSFRNIFHFRSILKDFVEGDIISLTIFRDGKHIVKPMQLKYFQPSIQNAVKFHYKLKDVLVSVNKSNIDQNELINSVSCCSSISSIPNVDGICVRYLNEDSLSGKMGLRENDVITTVNYMKVNDMKSFKKALSIHSNLIILTIVRNVNKTLCIIL